VRQKLDKATDHALQRINEARQQAQQATMDADLDRQPFGLYSELGPRARKLMDLDD
jgi:hypothetical protein